MKVEEITHLKILAVAYELALEFDYCPDVTQSKQAEEYLGKEISPAVFMLSGQSSDEIVNKILRIINKA